MASLSLLNNISIPFFKQGTRKYIFLCLVIFNISNLYPQQNYVQNGSFEELNDCPSVGSSILRANYWFAPSMGSPDLFNNCGNPSDVGVPSNNFGFQNAYDGNGYAGFISFGFDEYYREYIGSKLLLPLKPNFTYCFSARVSLADNKQVISDFGAYVSTDSLFFNTEAAIPVIPQIINSPTNYLQNDTSWAIVEGHFIANGGEKYIYIGNFSPDSLIHLYQIDSSYVMSYYYVDNIQLYECDSLNSINEYPVNLVLLYPNPAQNVINVVINFPNNKPATLRVFDLAGKAILVKQLAGMINEVDIAHVPNGLYIYDIIQNNTAIKHGKFIIAK